MFASNMPTLRQRDAARGDAIKMFRMSRFAARHCRRCQCRQQRHQHLSATAILWASIRTYNTCHHRCHASQHVTPTLPAATMFTFVCRPRHQRVRERTRRATTHHYQAYWWYCGWLCYWLVELIELVRLAWALWDRHWYHFIYYQR